MCGPDPTAGAEAIHPFVLLFPGPVLTDCRLRFATSVQALRALHHSIPLREPILMVPFPSLADNWLLSYLPFFPLVLHRFTFRYAVSFNPTHIPIFVFIRFNSY